MADARGDRPDRGRVPPKRTRDASRDLPLDHHHARDRPGVAQNLLSSPKYPVDLSYLDEWLVDANFGCQHPARECRPRDDVGPP